MSVLGLESLSPARRRYWTALARRLGSSVDVVDPDRRTLKELRAMFPVGTVVYRASTGGRWGKSSQRVRL